MNDYPRIIVVVRILTLHCAKEFRFVNNITINKINFLVLKKSIQVFTKKDIFF